jgi:hypothetical protein
MQQAIPVQSLMPHHDSGRMQEVGAIYETTPYRAAELAKRGLVKLVEVAAEAVAAVEQQAEPQEADLSPWLNRFSPRAYLDRWPNGPEAELARRHLEAESGPAPTA